MRDGVFRRFNTASRFRRGTLSKRPPLVCASVNKSFLSRSSAVPFREFVREGKIVAAAARDATGRDELEDFRADHRHSASSNLGANTAGATHRAQMPEQPKPGHINRGSEKSSLG